MVLFHWSSLLVNCFAVAESWIVVSIFPYHGCFTSQHSDQMEMDKEQSFCGFLKKKKITVWEKILIKLWNLLPWEVLNAEGVPGLLRQLRFLLSVTGEEGLQACIFQWHVLLPCSCGSLVTGCQSAFQSRNYPLISKLLSNELRCSTENLWEKHIIDYVV